jgi:hypothetical protein
MAINYTQAFNAGEVSRKMDGRSDLEIYKTGCRDLDNFFVLPQGGVERRAGTEFIQFAGTDGTNPARMIEFDFSSDIRFVIELGTSYAKVHYTDANGVAQVVDVTGTVPAYTSTELRQIQFNRKYDTLILTCPTKETQVLKRTTITPTFTIENISFVYPPLQEENITSTTIDPSLPSPNIYSGTTTLLASSALFHKGHEDSHWAIDHIRAADKKEIADTRTTNGEDAASDPLDVSFSNWSFETDGTWEASVVIQRRIDGGSWVNYIVIGDTRGGVARNFKYASTTPEGGNTELRVKWILQTSTQDFQFSIEAENVYHKGVVKITDVAGSDVVISSAVLNGTTNLVTIDTATAHGLSTGDYVLIAGLGYTTTNPDIEAQITVTDTDTFTYALTGADETFTTSSSSIIEATSRATATVVSMIQGGNFDDPNNPTVPQDPDATLHWSEGAFSTYRGFCPASEFFENRLWLAGSKDQPADIFASVFGEIFNFLSGSLSTDAIKRTIDSPEEPKWLESKRYLFLGTAGTAVSIRSADRDSLITQNNITTLVENAYGSAALQAEVANDVVVYVQRDGLKVRELVYSQSEDTFVGNDLNLISEDITESGIVEMFIQKQPNQFIWCIKENGDACVLTYERGQNVRGWARIDTDGEYYSAASIHNGGEDTVWACVKRDSKYCIEKFHPRKDLDWYVDSGKRLESGTAKSISSSDITTDIVITSNSHGFSDGDFVELSGTISSQLNKTPYRVSDSTTNTFKIKTTDDSAYIRYNTAQNIIADGSSIYSGTWELVDLGEDTWQQIVDGNPIGDPVTYRNYKWSLKDSAEGSEIILSTSDGQNYQWDLLEGETGNQYTLSSSVLNPLNRINVPWWEESLGSTVLNGYNFSFGSGATVQAVYNEVTGLNHLEGKTVQVVGNGSFIEEATVSSNKITTDQYYSTLLVGLPYTSTLRPMPIEPNLVNKLSQSRVKATSKIIVRFFETKGAKVGEAGRQLTTYPVVDTQDPTGQPVPLKTGQQRFFVGSDYEREKLIEVRQDLPYPMTVLSIASHVNAEGA